MNTGFRNPIAFMEGKYIGNGERNKDENCNKSIPNLQIKPDPYISKNQIKSLESKKNQTNNIKENDQINQFIKGSKNLEQNPSQSDISNNNNMAFSSDRIKQQIVQENDFHISINNQIRSINDSMNNQSQLMNEIQQQIDKLTMEQDAIKNQIGQINQMLFQQKQFFETQMMTLTSSIQQLIPKNNVVNNSNPINNINSNNQIPNFNDDNRNAFNNNNNLNSIGPNNNNIVKFKDSQGTFDVVFKEDESVFWVIQKYRKKVNVYGDKKFVFNGKEINPDLSCKNANLTNNSIIYVNEP